MWQLLMLLLWKWWTTLDFEMLSLPDTKFDSMAWSIASESCLTFDWSILGIWTKFLESSAYCIVINCTFNFSKTNIFGCFYCITTQFEFIKHKLCSFQITHWLTQCTKYWCTNYQNTAKHTKYLPWLELLQLLNIFTANLYVLKYGKTFDLLKYNICLKTNIVRISRNLMK